MLTLRFGPSEPGRIMYPVSLGEIEVLARDHGLAIVRALDTADPRARIGVSWTTICLRQPDDGTLGLPLIRGLILNDDKSSTYKLGLLRVVARIADAAPALAVPVRSEFDRVAVPLGLVALNWLRAYLPLVAAALPQAPNNRGPDGLSFAKRASGSCWHKELRRTTCGSGRVSMANALKLWLRQLVRHGGRSLPCQCAIRRCRTRTRRCSRQSGSPCAWRAR